MTLPTLKQGDSGDDVRFFEELLSSLFMFGQALEKLNYEIRAASATNSIECHTSSKKSR